MAAKLALVIIALGACCCGLLALRQARLQAAHELTQALLRARVHEERLLIVRARIAELSSPDAVRDIIEQFHDDLGPLTAAIDARVADPRANAELAANDHARQGAAP